MSKLSKISFLFAGFSLVAMSITRYLLGDWVPFCWLALGLAVVFVLVGLIKDRAFFKEFFTMKTTKEGMSMGMLILLLLAVLGAVNYIGARHTKTWDFSSARVNTLSEQSIQLVKNLDSDLKVYFFYKKGVEGNEENRRLFRELIKKYQDHSSKVQLDFVEVNERPDLAQEYGIDKGSGVVFLDYKGRRNRIEKIDEQDFTSALVKVTREKNKTVYFTVGHGEKALSENKEGLGLGSLKSLLENNRYTVKELSLIQNAKIPDDADVIVVAGPVQGFQAFEIEALEGYLKNGGSLFLAIESQNTAGLEKLVAKMGVQFENNYILNQVETVMGKGINQGPTMGVIFSMNNKITKPFGRSEVTLFRYPQSLKKVDIVKGVVVDELVSTAPNAMAFPSMQIRGEGPENTYALVDEVSGKWAGDENAKDFAAIIAGDVDFLTNQMLYQNLNRDLVLNSIAALAKEENLISITPKEPLATQMIMTETKFGLFLFAFIIPLPILLLGTSIGLWLRRRNA
ncbi:GldG family protein [Bdellovibrio bacteriovorus]|uniref:ABC-type transport system involved in gliding motility n=1 Tax=Bdellovibrio bacteriovorus str. Tiberius TaxID=1069642 RepID=K7YVE8_BDEBC|nr:GldG family protein [Bdellovibrio bacteriovorus]AFY00670.1 ABC-type transport system involved in gliding motility [Bdellovibrio bacteriovorus str. Tiberius]